MASPQSQPWRFRSDVARIDDFRCPPHSAGCSAEEQSTRNSIVFTRRGMFVRHVDGDDILADANRVLFFREDECYHVSHPVPGGDDCTVIELHREVLAELLARHEPRTRDAARVTFARTHVPADSASLWMQRRLLSRVATGAAGESLAIEESAIRLADHVLACGESRAARHDAVRDETRRAHREWVDGARTWLARTYAAPQSLAEIARAVHCSPYHLCRMFRRLSGMTIHQYRHRLRLRAGLERLAESPGDLSALALDLGFDSHSHFTNAFRREFGLTPSQARRSLSVRGMRQMSRDLQA